MKDGLKENAVWIVSRWANEEDFLNKRIYTEEEAYQFFGQSQHTVVNKNLALNEGITEFWTIICTSGGTKFDNTHSYIGVGDSTTAVSATQTGLQATTNKIYKPMDSSYPQVSNQTAIFRSTFLSSEANWAWNEVTLANGNSDSAVNFNRKIASLGTKISGQVWKLTLQITLS